MAPKNRNARPLPTPQVPLNLRLRFSFEHYDTTSDRYCLSRFSSDEVRSTLGRLSEVNKLTYNEIRQKGRVYHFHDVDWSRTSERGGFPNEALAGLEAFQFAILGVNNQRARVYGALYENTFYIVWFDRDHVITPSAKKGT
jgi:hypothetical protein